MLQTWTEDSYPSGILPETVQKMESNITLLFGFWCISSVAPSDLLLWLCYREEKWFFVLMPPPCTFIEKRISGKGSKALLFHYLFNEPLSSGMDSPVPTHLTHPWGFPPWPMPHWQDAWGGGKTSASSQDHPPSLLKATPEARIRGFGENRSCCRAIIRAPEVALVPGECWGKWEAGYCTDKWLWNPGLFFLQ